MRQPNQKNIKSSIIEAHPSFDIFEENYKSGHSQVLWARLVADLETPVSAYLKLCKKKIPSLLLESVEGGETKGRYSIIAYAPDIVWKSWGSKAVRYYYSPKKKLKMKEDKLSTLESLRKFLGESKLKIPRELPPMSAAIFGFLGYDTVRLVEKLDQPKVDTLEIPDSILIRPQIILIFDNVKDEFIFVTPVWYEKKIKAHKVYKDAVKRLEKAINSLDKPLSHENIETKWSDSQLSPQSNTTEDEYLSVVENAKNYIRAGDIFQVVLSQRFSIPFSLPSFSLYRALRRLNPSPYLFHLQFDDFSLVGSSPEILVRLRDKEIVVRPIAGTAPRGENEEEDKINAEKLIQDPKERSEHLMLLDLGRNDVGRVSKVGTVKVTHQFSIEKYSHVMHIVSNIVGILEENKDCIDALMAGFPAGTVTGAPKVRAMQIIDELETTKRGPYAGCVGYFTANGEMDTCITLRTAIVKNNKLYVQAGAGVVFDSIAIKEHNECVNKAKAILSAAHEAMRYANIKKHRNG